MRTRAQKRERMPEMVQQLQYRLRVLEEATARGTASATPVASNPATSPAPKKRKTKALSSSPLILTPQHPKPCMPALSAPKSPEKITRIETSVVKCSTLRRTLRYTPSTTSLEPVYDSKSVLQRICSGQMLRTDLSIVGRVEEHQIIREVLKGSEMQRGSLFIIGPPGTGKSTSVDKLLLEQGYEVMEDVNTLKRERVKKCLKTAVKFNCSTFVDPAALYAAVAQQVNNTTSWNVPERLDPFDMDNFLALQRCGSRSKKHAIVIVLDEVDQLLRLPVRMQPTVKEVLHFFVRWAAIAPCEVQFLGIMNGVDMYQQVSRVHVTRESAADSHVPRVVFGSYSHKDLLLIMQSYMQSVAPSKMGMEEVSDIVEPRAIELIARKVAARDGDARLAISLLQQSARHALQRFNSSKTTLVGPTQVKVTMRDVFQCVTAMLSSPVAQQIRQLPRLAKLLLYVITALAPGANGDDGRSSLKRTLQQCDMNAVSEELARLRGLPQTAWIPRLSREELQTHLTSLDCYALVRQGGTQKASRPAAVMSARAFWSIKLYSCVTMIEVSKALQDDTSLSQLLL